MKTILIVGDSYSFGQGCKDREWEHCSVTGKIIKGVVNYNVASESCWGSLIQKNYSNVNVINLSRPGNSNQLIFKSIIDSKIIPDIVFFAGTYHDRVVFSKSLESNLLVSCLLSSVDAKYFDEPKYYSEAKRNYLKYLFNDELGRLNSITSIYAAYGYIRSMFKSKFFWSCPKMITESGLIESDTIHELKPLFKYKIPSIQEFDFSGKSNYDMNSKFLTKCRHINERGHSIYYSEVISKILDNEL